MTSPNPTSAKQLDRSSKTAGLLRELEMARAALVRAQTSEALAAATIQAIHWLFDKASPITTAVERMQMALQEDPIDRTSIQGDLERVAEAARAILAVKEVLFGSAREPQLRPALVADVVQAAAFFAGVQGEMLTITLAPETPLVLTDTTHLARALAHLFENALEAQATRVSANITPTLEPGYVAISIADDGAGIAPEVREKMWATFFSTKDPSHHGLGLSAVLLLIAQLDGRVTVDSQPGRGASFTVVIPAAPDDEAVDLSHAPENILFIDEEDDAWAMFAANVLKLAGKNVIVQGNPAGAGSAELILIDEALTTMPVDEVLAALQEAGATGKAVVVTAALNAARAARYLQAGARDVVLKPYTYSALAAFLHQQKGYLLNL